MVTHCSTNRAPLRATTLIKANALPLSQTATTKLTDKFGSVIGPRPELYCHIPTGDLKIIAADSLLGNPHTSASKHAL